MPTGVILNVLAVVIGGVLGTVLGDRLSQRIKDALNAVFSLCAMLLGITSAILVKNMSAVILSVIIGTVIGTALKLGDKVNQAAVAMEKGISRFISPPKHGLKGEAYTSTLVTILVLFVASGTGIYGSIVSGMSRDHSILIAKSILDLFTAMIFACSLGAVVSFIAVPQFIFFFVLFLLARVIFPLTNETMINDFKACGGVILIATAFRMMHVKEFSIVDMVPSMIIVMPVSAFWVKYITPLLGG